MAKGQKPPQRQTTLWDFLIAVVNRLYNLLKTGNVFYAIILTLLLNSTIFLVKYPSNELPDLVRWFGKYLNNEKFYIFPLGSLVLLELGALIYQRNKYKKEIDRLCEERKQLVHGLKNNELSTISKHHSSKNENLNDSAEE